MPEGLATGGGNDVALSARTARKRVVTFKDVNIEETAKDV